MNSKYIKYFHNFIIAEIFWRILYQKNIFINTLFKLNNQKNCMHISTNPEYGLVIYIEIGVPLCSHFIQDLNSK